MKYYAACATNEGIRAAIVAIPKRVLLSYFYFSKPQLIKDLLAKGVEVFIDSGAFSARSSGKPIKLEEYCQFLLETGVTTYAGLDVIGDAEATMINQKRMETEFGLKPIPTFHLGSDIKDLEALYAYDYIAFGGLVHSPGIENHLDEAWKYILENCPKMRVHGFGVTNLKFIEKYPWYSIDSSSYSSCPRYGRQPLLAGGKNFETISEDEFLQFLQDNYCYPREVLDDLATRRHLEQLFAVNSIKTFVDIITEIHQLKDFNFLVKQNRLL
jgi:hypothetical protein